MGVIPEGDSASESCVGNRLGAGSSWGAKADPVYGGGAVEINGVIRFERHLGGG